MTFLSSGVRPLRASTTSPAVFAFCSAKPFPSPSGPSPPSQPCSSGSAPDLPCPRLPLLGWLDDWFGDWLGLEAPLLACRLSASDFPFGFASESLGSFPLPLLFWPLLSSPRKSLDEFPSGAPSSLGNESKRSRGEFLLFAFSLIESPPDSPPPDSRLPIPLLPAIPFSEPLDRAELPRGIESSPDLEFPSRPA